ncbi:MAG: F0F1 ATP synthase subunit delta [Verrucomicrobiae bacterium]|nr:F0F1 ATP synthase subunit delta [Verrucomicrobiae bacterium]
MKSRRDSRRAARRIFRACFADSRLDTERVRRAVRSLGGQKPRQGLAVLEEFHRLVRTEVTRWQLRIESAAPLPPECLAELQARVAARAGRPVESAASVNPALIGGLRLRLGSDVWDGSVAQRLRQLEVQSEK